MTTTDTPLMPETHTPLRVVINHRTGALAGLSQILGTTDDMPRPWPINEVLPDGKAVGMVKQRRGALYYQEIVKVEGLKTFNGAQV